MIITRFLAVLSVVFATYWAGVLGYWSSQREIPIHLHTLDVLDHPVPPGGTLRMRVSVHRTKLCYTSIDRWIYDGQQVRYTLQPLDYAEDPGPVGTSEFTALLPIPVSAFPGKAKLRMTLVFVCNPTHHIWPITTTMEIPFVIGSDPS